MSSDWLVPFVDLGETNIRYSVEMLTAAKRVIASGIYIMGPQLEAFEYECAHYLGVKHAIGVNSGTDALSLAIRAVDWDCETIECWIVPAMTFIATTAAVHHSLLPLQFQDVNPKTGMIPGDCYKPVVNEYGITTGWQGVIPVHLYGAPQPDIDRLKMDFRFLIEDAAEAFGASYPDGRKVGTIGDAGCFSFFPTKTLGGFGDGGLVVTNSEDVAARVRLLRNHGRLGVTDEHTEIGYNSRLDEIQAAWLRIKLRDVDLRNRQRALIALRYQDEFGAMNYLNQHTHVEWPLFRGTCVYQVCVCLLPADQRDRVYAELREDGVEAKIHWPMCVPDQPAFGNPNSRTPGYPNARLWARRCLTLPCYSAMTDEQIQHVVDSMRRAMRCG